jgi:uncharacterized protein YjbI with pentapeptide repeats
MADRELLSRLRRGSFKWNKWRLRNPDVHLDLSLADLRGFNLSDTILGRADLTETNLERVDLRSADLGDAKLGKANLGAADLSYANLAGADLSSADLSAATLSETKLQRANLSGARLSWASLRSANLTGASLVHANLEGVNLSDALLDAANLAQAGLRNGNLESASMTGTNLSGAYLGGARLGSARMSQANLTKATLSETDLSFANLEGANLSSVDLRSAKLQNANLDNAILSDVQLWQAQLAGWSIKDIECAGAFWDRDAEEFNAYEPGEFERLYSAQSYIELMYRGGISTFELSTLPALIHHLSVLHPHSHIRLKSVEETGGGAKIFISVGDADLETTERIRADAMQVYQAQLILRDNDVERLRIENTILNNQNDKLINALLSAGTQHNTFNAPVYGATFPSGNARVKIVQTINDNSALLALLERIMERSGDLSLNVADADHLETEVLSAKIELEKAEPSPTILARSLKFVQKLAGEAVTKAAGKLGEQAVSSDWPSLLHQLNQFVAHLK